MFLPPSDISWLDVVLEGLKVLGMLGLVIVLWRTGRRYPDLATRSWSLILAAFVLMFIGFAFDWSDEVLNYPAWPVAEAVEAWIEELSLIGGLILATIGFTGWFTFVARFMGLKAKA